MIVARTGYTGEDGVEIFCSHEKARSIWKSLMEAGATPCGLASRDVLREHGNMSSPTVLFILERLRRAEVRGPAVVIGFGPGLVAEAALIELP